MPIGICADLGVEGGTIREIVTHPKAQVATATALHEQFNTPLLLTAMDLSAEAEAFGCEIRMSDTETPTVIGRRATNLADVEALPVPRPGDARTKVHIEAARRLVKKAGSVPVLGFLIGPISLAGRIYGVSEALEATVMEPEIVLSLLDKTTRFLSDYAKAFREAGASGVVIAEPVAGLLSPAGLGEFSAPFVKRIVDETETDEFAIILHNCGVRLPHLNKMLESGAGIYHVSSPMDIVEALRQVEGKVILAGNLDPTGIFKNGTPEYVYEKTRELLNATRDYRNFIISSGCDLPPATPPANLGAFYKALAEFNTRT
jgi:uroporphyrinogen decarboxylase